MFANICTAIHATGPCRPSFGRSIPGVASYTDSPRMEIREPLVQPQSHGTVHGVPERLGQRSADAAPLVASKAKSPTAAPRSSRGTYRNAATFSGAKHRQADDDHHPRPHRLPGTDRASSFCDIQIVRHGHYEQARGDQPAGIHTTAQRNPTISRTMIGEMPAGDCTRPEARAS